MAIQAELERKLAEANAEIAAKRARQRQEYGTTVAKPNIAIGDRVKNAFSTALGIERTVSDDIIEKSLGSKRTNTNTGNYFKGKHALLNPITFTKLIKTAYIGGVGARLLKEGSYGSAWHGDDGAVYKVILIDDEDVHYREVFIEAFIQILLQVDAAYGKNIAKLEQVYRINGRRDIGFVCRMEFIRYPFDSFIPTLGSPAPMDAVAPVFAAVGNMLAHFENKYGFHHRDLHTGNLMFAADGTPKLIDFGMACIVIGGHVYSVDNIPCIAYDPLIFVASLYGYYMRLFDEPMRIRIREYMTGRDGVDYYTKIEKWIDSFYDPSGNLLNPHNRPPLSAVQHYFYHKYSFNATHPNDRRPWNVDDIPGRKWLQSFESAGMPTRGTYAYFAKAWGDALPPLSGGARKTRRAKVSRRPKATRRFK